MSWVQNCAFGLGRKSLVWATQPNAHPWSDLNDPYLMTSLRILNLIEVEEEGEIFDKVAEKVSLLQVMMSLKRKNLTLAPHKIIQDLKSDPIWFLQKLIEKTSFLGALKVVKV